MPLSCSLKKLSLLSLRIIYTINKNEPDIHYSKKQSLFELLLILPFFLLDQKETKNQGSEFLFCSQFILRQRIRTRSEQF
jgi:hypothetical protein